MIQPKVWRVSAFSEGSLEGNPAGVVIVQPEDDWPSDSELQAVAKEVGYSETSFLRAQDDGTFQLRWFTPTVEVDLCGHATLAAAFVLWNNKTASESPLVFSTLSGQMKVSRDTAQGRISLDFPADVPTYDSKIEELRQPLAAALRIEQKHISDTFSGRLDSVVVVDDERHVFQCRPDFDAIQKLETRGVLLTAKSKKSSASDFTSRFFVPRCGIPEDPVTGSAHCLLGPYWAKQLEKSSMVAYQASEQGGMLYIHWPVSSDRIQISGFAKFI